MSDDLQTLKRKFSNKNKTQLQSNVLNNLSKQNRLSTVALAKSLTRRKDSIILDGDNLTIRDIISVARGAPQIDFTKDSTVLERISRCHSVMMQQIKDGVPTYGCNTGYGEQASVVLINDTPEKRIKQAKAISEGILMTDVSVGPAFQDEVVRAGILVRINMLMKGVSAIKLADLDLYRQLLNKQVTPLVSQFGGIGASGDLAHNSRILSALCYLPSTQVKDKNGCIGLAAEILAKAGIPKLDLDPKAGLGLVNGDNFSTGLAALLATDTLNALLISYVVGAMTIECLKGTNRSFHPLLAAMRPHEGQLEMAKIYRYLLKDSQLAFQEMEKPQPRDAGVKIQDGYSLRCVAQYLGVSIEKIKNIFDTIGINANSSSDNPLWVPPEKTTKGEEPWQWVSGGNFLAMHMSEAMDSLRKIMTHIVKLNDRHLSRMVNKVHNNGLPPNLSDPIALTQCTFKGVDIQSGMFEVYSSLLSIPINTFFGVHEEGNQDITSHALTSGILGLENLKLVRYSLAQNIVALCQAVRLRGGSDLLSPATRPLYEFASQFIPYISKEEPLHLYIEMIYQKICDESLTEVVLNQVFAEFEE